MLDLLGVGPFDPFLGASQPLSFHLLPFTGLVKDSQKNKHMTCHVTCLFESSVHDLQFVTTELGVFTQQLDVIRSVRDDLRLLFIDATVCNRHSYDVPHYTSAPFISAGF